MRLVAVADSDSYVKWAAFLISGMPADWDISLLVVRTPKLPSEAQLADALAGSRLQRAEVDVVELDVAVSRIAAEKPDAVLVATIGPLADIVAEDILAASSARPVILSGLPGIALPARRKALLYRSQVDLIVLHSKREISRFAAIAAHNGFSIELGLATFPFFSRTAIGETQARPTDIIFAAQAIVPLNARDRILLLSWLVSLARANPKRRVVIKARAARGEQQTHAERDSFEDLLARKFAGAPANLVVETGPMSEHLASAAALVTVSSTAALEAAAIGVPVLVLDEFGIGPELINEVFVGSGLFGSADELIEGSFKTPNPRWMADNYFHDASDNSWLWKLQGLIEANRRGELAPRERIVRGPGGALRRAWDRKQALGSADRSALGAIALVIGTPARAALIGSRALFRVAAGRRPQPPTEALTPEGERPTLVR